MTRVSEDGNFGVIVEVNSETDFVARDDNFLNFAHSVLEAAYTTKESDVARLMAGDLEARREALVQKIGENINVRRIEIVSFADANKGIVDSYVHSNNRIAVLVALQGGDSSLAKDISMHVAASNPVVVRAEDVPKELLAKESEIYSAQARDSGKPEEIIEKMIQGRLRKFVAEISLVEQQFVKDPEVTVAALLKKAGADVISFVRYEVGEGIVKEVVDFAQEVAAQARKPDDPKDPVA
jgi:elongation factor Ts